MEMLVTKFSKGKYRNEGDLFAEPISAENVKLMGEMIALQALRTVKKFDMKVADRLYIGLIKDLHHMGEIDYIISDGYDVAQTAICFLYQFAGRKVSEIYGKDRKGKEISIKLACYREVKTFLDHAAHLFHTFCRNVYVAVGIRTALQTIAVYVLRPYNERFSARDLMRRPVDRVERFSLQTIDQFPEYMTVHFGVGYVQQNGIREVFDQFKSINGVISLFHENIIHYFFL